MSQVNNQINFSIGPNMNMQATNAPTGYSYLLGQQPQDILDLSTNKPTGKPQSISEQVHMMFMQLLILFNVGDLLDDGVFNRSFFDAFRTNPSSVNPTLAKGINGIINNISGKVQQGDLQDDGKLNGSFMPEYKLNDGNYTGDLNYNEQKGYQITLAAQDTVNEMNSTGWCARGVRIALEKAGINGIGAASAYQVADKIAVNQNFNEVSVSRDQLDDLPAGTVVVWDKSPGHEHGHISIADGNGNELSDHKQKQIQNRNAGFRVFVPV